MKSDTVQELIAQCASGKPEQQSLALMDLVAARAAQAVPAIVPLLGAADLTVRANAVYALGALGAEHVDVAGPALVMLLEDPEPLLRSEAITALGILAYQPAAERIAGLLEHDPDPLVRAEAAETLGDMGATPSVPALHTALARDPDESVRTYAANAIGLLGEPPSHAVLQECLAKEDSVHVRAEILGARYRLGDTAALPPLLAIFGTADEDLSACLLNLLEDLLSRRQPPALAADAAAIRAALEQVARREPDLQPQVEQLRVYLPRS
jgi:HEAT repeat protein